MKKEIRILKTTEDTNRLGTELAESIVPGTVIALTGDLGAGKTTLTQSIARALGVKARLTSPTFTIVQEYDDGRLPVYHFDVYRIHDEEDLFELGFDEYINGKGVCLIEWADLIEDLIPEDAMRINLSYGSEESERICEICTF